MLEEGGIRVNTQGVFFNRYQVIARDVLYLVLKVLKPKNFLDAFSASGIRALRAAKLGISATAVDISKEAVERIKENAKLNSLEIEVIRSDCRRVMVSRRFEFIDLDPFGNPVAFLEVALKAAKKYLAVTATDTAALCGVYPRVSLRRYGSYVVKRHNYHEIGVRNLAGYVVRVAASMDIAARPVFAHAFKHYYRVYFEIKRGAKRAEQLLKNVGKYLGIYGPIWLGPLWEEKLLKRVTEAAKVEKDISEKTRKILKLIEEESKLKGFYVDIHEVCSHLGLPVPKFSKILDMGNFSRTHFSPTGIRGNSEAEVINALLDLYTP